MFSEIKDTNFNTKSMTSTEQSIANVVEKNKIIFFTTDGPFFIRCLLLGNACILKNAYGSVNKDGKMPHEKYFVYTPIKRTDCEIHLIKFKALLLSYQEHLVTFTKILNTHKSWQIDSKIKNMDWNNVKIVDTNPQIIKFLIAYKNAGSDNPNRTWERLFYDILYVLCKIGTIEKMIEIFNIIKNELKTIIETLENIHNNKQELHDEEKYKNLYTLLLPKILILYPHKFPHASSLELQKWRFQIGKFNTNVLSNFIEDDFKKSISQFNDLIDDFIGKVPNNKLFNENKDSNGIQIFSLEPYQPPQSGGNNRTEIISGIDAEIDNKMNQGLSEKNDYDITKLLKQNLLLHFFKTINYRNIIENAATETAPLATAVSVRETGAVNMDQEYPPFTPPADVFIFGRPLDQRHNEPVRKENAAVKRTRTTDVEAAAKRKRETVEGETEEGEQQSRPPSPTAMDTASGKTKRRRRRKPKKITLKCKPCKKVRVCNRKERRLKKKQNKTVKSMPKIKSKQKTKKTKAKKQKTEKNKKDQNISKFYDLLRPIKFIKRLKKKTPEQKNEIIINNLNRLNKTPKRKNMFGSLKKNKQK